MNTLKKIGKWLLFLVSGYFGTNIVLAVALTIPLFAFLWIQNWSMFWFLVVGSILLSVYYYIILGLFVLYFSFINKTKPDYWVSNIFLIIVAIISIITYAMNFTSWSKMLMELSGFRAILFMVAIAPSYLYILYMLFISIFFSTEESN